jgi:hypothetical protein
MERFERFKVPSLFLVETTIGRWIRNNACQIVKTCSFRAKIDHASAKSFNIFSNIG